MLDLFGSSLVLTMAIAGVSACIDVAVHFARGGFAATRPARAQADHASCDRGSVILRPAFGAAH